MKLSNTIFILNLFFVHELIAQPIWIDRNKDKTIAFEFLKPDFENIENLTFMTSAMFLSGRFKVSKNIYFIGDIPFVNVGVDREYGEDVNENSFGNPYVGIEVQGENNPVFAEFGIRIPLIPEDENYYAQTIGALTEFIERSEAFVSDIIPLFAMVNYQNKNEQNIAFRIRTGFSGWIATADRNKSKITLR